jgi:glutaredoxin-like YruB-family protein
MKQLLSYNELSEILKTYPDSWLLLYKRGSEKSDCAFDNYGRAAAEVEGGPYFWADVNEVRDIHPVFGITTVPSLLEYKGGTLVNIVKGCHQPEQFSSLFENRVFVAGQSADEKPAKNVTVFTTPTCSWCTTLKRHLDAHQVRYREIDVSKDQKAAEAMVKRSGKQGVPQTDINGQMIVGFDRERINRLLDIR